MSAIIFDMDGVIIDSEPVHMVLEAALFDELGITLAPGEHESYMGTSAINMFTSLKARHGLSESVNSLLERSRNRYMKILRSGEISLVEGAVALIHKLHREGWFLAVASSAPHEQIDTVMEHFQLGFYFRSRVSGDDVETSKPHPEIFLKTAANLGVNPENCWVIEDSENGVKAAKSARMRCIGFVNPGSGRQNLSEADHVVDSLNQVSRLLDG